MFKIIGSDGKQYGPIPVDTLRGWIKEGRANGQTLVQLDGTPEWKPLSAWVEFAADLHTPALPPLIGYTSADVSARASSKVPAGICGILLGALGVHKFILGYTTTGVIMLLITVLSCGWGAFATGIIGLIEGIIYLTKSDEVFVQTYVVGRKEWF